MVCDASVGLSVSPSIAIDTGSTRTHKIYLHVSLNCPMLIATNKHSASFIALSIKDSASIAEALLAPPTSHVHAHRWVGLLQLLFS